MILSIPSDFKFLGAVDAAIQDLAREFLFPQDVVNDVSTALIEACSNAIEHGNRFAPDKRVVITLGFNGDAFSATVKDEGPGFDFAHALEDDQSPPELMSERGRGIMIMRAFTDGITFSYANGLQVELTKLRRGGARDEA